MADAFKVVRDFESALCDYTGAPYAVTVNSCTMALLLAVAWHLRDDDWENPTRISIPKRTYVSVPQSIIHAGGVPAFRNEEWVGCYQLKPLPVWDSARWFTAGMYGTVAVADVFCADDVVRQAQVKGSHTLCVSFHWTKTLGIQQGGAILHDNAEADAWLRRARFDGRTEGVAPKDDRFDMIGWHCYMSPEIAAAGLVRLMHLPQHNEPLPNDEYPDLSEMAIFR